MKRKILTPSWTVYALLGILTFLTASVNYAGAEENALDDVAQTKKQFATLQYHALIMREMLIQRITGDNLGVAYYDGLVREERGVDGDKLGAPSKAEIIAAFFIGAMEGEVEPENSDAANAAVKSLKIVPWRVGGKNVVRVLYRDGSVIYYDGLNLDGKVDDFKGRTDLGNAPSDAEIAAIPEFDCGPGGYNNWLQVKKISFLIWPESLNARRQELEPDIERAIETLAQKRKECLEWLQTSDNEGDRRFALEMLAGYLARVKYVELPVADPKRKPAIQSIKIVPLDSPKEWSSTYGAVRVLFSDGSVRYYDEDELNGEREPANAPSEEVVAKILDFEIPYTPETPPESYVADVKKRLNAIKTRQAEATK